MPTRSGKVYTPLPPSPWPRLVEYGIAKACKCEICSSYRESMCAAEESRVKARHPGKWEAYCAHERATRFFFQSRTTSLHARHAPLPTPEQSP